MRRRAIGLALLGVGAFALGAALFAGLALAPTLVRLPLDQTGTSVASDDNATYLDMGALQQRTGALTATVKVQGDAGSADASDEVAVWRSGTTILTDKGDLVTASKSTTCLDRRSAQAVPCTAETRPVTGLTVTFPLHTQAHDYQVWNGDAGRAFTARYAGTATVDGVDVYRFREDIPETVISHADVPGVLAGTPAAATVHADVVYRNSRVLLVEPTSGKIVSAQEHPVTRLRGPDGATGATVLDANFASTAASVRASAHDAADLRSQIRTVETVLPWSVAGLGLVLVIAGAVLVALAPREPAAAGSVGRHVPVAAH